MEKIQSWLPAASLILGLWLLVNGILHDVFVVIKYHKEYNRQLLALLMDGHVLMTCGILFLITYRGFANGNQSWAYYVAFTASVSILVYCGMIFPFLKSIGTILLTAVFLTVLIVSWFI